MSRDGEQQIGVWERLSEWVAKNPVKSATLVGGMFYALLWLGYNAFYGKFGVSVGEVGLGYVEILIQAWAYFVVIVVMVFVNIWALVLLFLAILFLLNGVASLVTTVLELFGPRLESKLDCLRSKLKSLTVPRLSLTGVLALSVVVTTALIVVIGFVDGRRFATAIRSGNPVSTPLIWNIVPSPYRFPGEKVHVEWIGQSPSPIKGGESLMYLGSGEATSIFYDYRHKKTLRIPSGAILIISPEAGPNEP